MTLLLFIASLGIVHYIVSRQPGMKMRKPDHTPAAAAPEAASSLFALGEALELHGRGAAPRLETTNTGTAEQAEEVAAVKNRTS